ncbi:PilW family protein [Uliginosibacterium sp. 31-16]|uniref:PilW family protein n=1 Tax=Uliginosibacterium sp. 31-16 TaxID=3068315 RepID=UPI00273F6453|nr:PilW family protein [Uliginosibacterium sp. 31-16]MDP5240136.1 PilW family protein [Uliginosibacterium sp. 31-16]
MKNNLRTTRPKNSLGLTLIELMVSMVLGLIVLAAVSAVYVSSKQTFRTNDNLARLQESVRIAFDLISRDVRQTAFYGCAGQDVNFSNALTTPNALLWNFSVPVSGYEASTSTAWNTTPDAAITAPLGGRDILVIRSIDEGGGPVTAHASASADLVVSEKSGISAGDVLLASNCRSATVFQATSVATASGTDTISHITGSQTPGNSTTDLSNTFINGELRKISTKVYYVSNNASGLPSLFVLRSSDGTSQELVEGIDGMQISYGIDDNDDFAADRYVTAADAESGSLWPKVVSIRITLTHISAEDFVATAAQSNSLGTATDRRLRREVTTTIALRNRAG